MKYFVIFNQDSILPIEALVNDPSYTMNTEQRQLREPMLTEIDRSFHCPVCRLVTHLLEGCTGHTSNGGTTLAL
jgi:hypothetical protein